MNGQTIATAVRQRTRSGEMAPMWRLTTFATPFFFDTERFGPDDAALATTHRDEQ